VGSTFENVGVSKKTQKHLKEVSPWGKVSTTNSDPLIGGENPFGKRNINEDDSFRGTAPELKK